MTVLVNVVAKEALFSRDDDNNYDDGGGRDGDEDKIDA